MPGCERTHSNAARGSVPAQAATSPRRMPLANWGSAMSFRACSAPIGSPRPHSWKATRFIRRRSCGLRVRATSTASSGESGASRIAALATRPSRCDPSGCASAQSSAARTSSLAQMPTRLSCQWSRTLPSGHVSRASRACSGSTATHALKACQPDCVRESPLGMARASRQACCGLARVSVNWRARCRTSWMENRWAISRLRTMSRSWFADSIAIAAVRL